MAAKGAIYPVEQMMNDAGEPFEKADFFASCDLLLPNIRWRASLHAI